MTFPSSLPIPEAVLAIARKIAGAGWEVWCVGGAVRDNLLDIPNKDFDLATSATPDVVRKLFRRTIPVGIEHGTVAVLDPEGTPHEVTTFRRDVRTDGRHAEVEFGVSLGEDLARRDFTINAIAYHPLSREWRDPFGGQADLGGKLIRAVGEPRQRFREDYLRIVRALRFAARFGFRIDPATWEAARAESAGLRNLSAERVRDEWFKGLSGARRPSELLELWVSVGAAEIWLPELVGGTRAAVSGRRGGLDRFPERDPVLMTAYVSDDPGATLTRLRCSNAEIERGRRIAAHRAHEPDPRDGSAVRRWMAAAGAVVDDLATVAQVEGRGDALARAVAGVRASGAPLEVAALAVTGQDVMTVGVREGPMVGQILRALLEDVLEDPSRNTRAYLVRRVETLRSQLTAHPDGEEGAGS